MSSLSTIPTLVEYYQRYSWRKSKNACNNSCEDDTILEPESGDSYGGMTFVKEHGTIV